jgi:hypothetical protein
MKTIGKSGETEAAMKGSDSESRSTPPQQQSGEAADTTARGGEEEESGDDLVIALHPQR